MKCEHCGMNEATFYCRSSVNGKVTEVHLCPDCAEKLGYTERFERQLHPASMFGDSLFGDSFFSRPFSLFEPLLGGLGSRMLTEFPSPVEEKPQAPEGLLNAEEQQEMQKTRERNALEAQLKAAVEREDFEEAIRLRDALKKMKEGN